MGTNAGMLLMDVESVAHEMASGLADMIRKLGGMLPRPDQIDKEAVLEFARRYGFAVWESRYKVSKFHGCADERDTLGRQPDDVVEKNFNLLTYGGASCMWQCLIGNGTATAGQNLTYFSNAQAAIGVGDSTTSPAATQTNLQASTNKLRVAMSATYPQHTDATTSGAATILFQGSFSSGQANFAWNECAIFNSTTDGVGRMLNRLAPGGGFGTKAAGTWTLQTSISLA